MKKHTFYLYYNLIKVIFIVPIVNNTKQLYVTKEKIQIIRQLFEEPNKNKNHNVDKSN